MVQAYSRLKRLLGEQDWTVPELHRHLRQQGWIVNLKSLYRLNDDVRPLARLDLRLAAAVCQVCQVPLSELIVFEAPATKLRRLPTAKQRRLEVLMAKNNDGRLTRPERVELGTLVREAEAITLENARLLAGQRQPAATP